MSFRLSPNTNLVTGDLTITGDLTVQGSATIDVNETVTGALTVQGQVIIDLNNVEAFLVRKNGDGGDRFWVDTNTDPTHVYIQAQSDAAADPDLRFRRSRAGLTVVQVGDSLGGVDYWGYDGANFIEAGGVVVFAEGTIASTRVPGRIEFRTGTDAAPTVLTEAFRIDSSQAVLSGIANGYALLNETPSSTNPVIIPFRGDLTTGIGGASQEISLITDSSEALKIDASGNVRVVEATLFVESAAGTNGIIVDNPDRTTAGQDDSHNFLQTATTFDSVAHDADWQFFVDATSNAGASTWTLQSRIDAAAFANFLNIRSDKRIDFGGVDTTSSTMFDNGSIRAAGNPGIWLGQTSPNITTNFAIAATGANQTRVNAVDTVHLTISNTVYLTATSVGVQQIEANRGLIIDGAVDQIQLHVQGNSTQTNPLVTFEQSDGTDVLTVDNTGQMALVTTGSGGGLIIGGDALWYRSAADVMRTPDSLTVDGSTILSGTLAVTGAITFTTTLTVAQGGIGATSLTDGGILLGSGTGAITALGVAANGQIPIGDGAGDPVLANIVGTANEVDITNGAGTIQIGLPASVIISTDLTITNDLNMSAGVAYGTEFDNGNSGTADTIDWNSGNKHKSTLTGNVTYTFTDTPGPSNLIIRIVQDATGGRTVTWPAAVEWEGGTAPTITVTANAIDIISFYYDGTTYYGSFLQDFS